MSRHQATEEYWGGHRPPEDEATLDDMGDWGGGDAYEHPEFYSHTGGGEPWEKETFRVLRSVRGKPDALVTIYRALPPGHTTIEPGDWVALSRGYCAQHAMQDDDAANDWPIIAAQVPAHTVRNGGNDVIEWGYWGPPVQARLATKTAGPSNEVTRAVWAQWVAPRFFVGETPDISKPGGIMRRNYDDVQKHSDEDNLRSAMKAWRGGFDTSMSMRAIIEGREPAPAYKEWYSYFSSGMLAAGLQRRTLHRDSWRIQPGDAPRVGQVLNWPAKAVAFSRRDAMPFRGGIFSGLASHDTLYHLPSGVHGLTFEDNREGIASGQFRVATVEPVQGDPLLSVVTLEDAGQAQFPAASRAPLTASQGSDDSQHAMVALRPSEGLRKRLADLEECTEDVDKLHLTLRYLGEIDPGDLRTQDRYYRALYDFALHSGFTRLTGTLNGYGVFMNGGDEGNVLVGLWDIPEIAEFRASLTGYLKAHAPDLREDDHGFTPHSSLTYSDQPIKQLPALPDGDLEETFGSIWLVWGTEWTEVTLS